MHKLSSAKKFAMKYILQGLLLVQAATTESLPSKAEKNKNKNTLAITITSGICKLAGPMFEKTYFGFSANFPGGGGGISSKLRQTDFNSVAITTWN